MRSFSDDLPNHDKKLAEKTARSAETTEQLGYQIRDITGSTFNTMVKGLATQQRYLISLVVLNGLLLAGQISFVVYTLIEKGLIIW